MTVLRSLLYAAIFYPATVISVLSGIFVMPFGTRPTLAVVLSWVRVHHRICEKILGIRSKVIGTFPTEPCLIAVKHESMYETLEMLRLSNMPVIVIKRELADIPLFGTLTRR
jgi:1-acyl-sn-glycerol-3-phosphate acyltransferase